MQLKVTVNGFPPKPLLRAYITRRIHFALDRFERHIERVIVHLTDLNGPRKGDDKRCRIAVEFRRGGDLMVTETRSDEMAAVYFAAARLQYRIANRMVSARASREKSSIRTADVMEESQYGRSYH